MSTHTVFSEIFAQNLNPQNFCTRESLERVEYIATYTWCDFVDTVQMTPDDVSF